MTPEPLLFRPKRALLIAVAPLLLDDAYLSMGEAQFVAAVMRATGGSVNPSSVYELYRELMVEAGVPLDR